MRYRLLFITILNLSVWFNVYSQETMQIDSLIRELQEIVVTAKQPATNLSVAHSFLLSQGQTCKMQEMHLMYCNSFH